MFKLLNNADIDITFGTVYYLMSVQLILGSVMVAEWPHFER